MSNTLHLSVSGLNYRFLIILTTLLFFIAACDTENRQRPYSELSERTRLFTIGLFQDGPVKSLAVSGLDNIPLFARTHGLNEDLIPLGHQFRITQTQNGIHLSSGKIDTFLQDDVEIVKESGCGLLNRYKVLTDTGREITFRGFITIHNSSTGITISIDSFEDDIIAYMMAKSVRKSDPRAYQEAMAVFYRTNLYAAHLENNGNSYFVESKRLGLHFDKSYPKEHHYNAIRFTESTIALFNNSPINLFATEICGGMTATPDMVWHEIRPGPQYQIVICNYCLTGDIYQWSNAVSSFTVAEALFDKKDDVKIWISSYYENGRPQYITAQIGRDKKIFTVEEFRQRISEHYDPQIILSDWFEIADTEKDFPAYETGPHLLRISDTFDRSDSNIIYFNGWGKGHGVGLCQDAARQQARSGKNYLEILQYYYPRITIGRIGSEQ